MILDEWGVKDHCVECGFPCRKSACVHHDAGVEIGCDACGKTWTVEAGSPLRTETVHLCDACMKTAVGETLTVTLPSATRAKPGHVVVVCGLTFFVRSVEPAGPDDDLVTLVRLGTRLLKRKHAMTGKQPYTALIKVPDAVDSDRPIYIVHVDATSARRAWLAAVQSLIADLEVDVRDLQDEDRFRCVALFHGHHKNFANLIERG